MPILSPRFAPVAKWSGTRLQSALRGFDPRPVLDAPEARLERAADF